MSQTKSSQGKTRRKPVTVVSAYSTGNGNNGRTQKMEISVNIYSYSDKIENLRDEDDPRLRVSASEQNIFKMSNSAKHQSPMARSKMTAPTVKKPQQVYGIPKGMAVVTGIRQGTGREEGPLGIELASTSVDALRKSLDQVIYLKTRVAAAENLPDQEPITRILDDGLLSVQRVLSESVLFQDTRPKILTEHEPTVL